MSSANAHNLTKKQQALIDRLLQYIGFVSRRQLSSATTLHNALATFDATMMLSSVDYTSRQLHAMLDDVDDTTPPARFARHYYAYIRSLLCDDINESFDESFILRIYDTLYGGMQEAGVTDMKGRLLPNKAVVHVNENLSELVEWLLVSHQNGTSHPLIDVAIFIYRFVNTRFFEQGCEPVVLLVMHRLLRQAGCDWIAFYSPAVVMAEGRVEYYRALHVGDESQWIVYFIHSVYEAARRVSAMFAPVLPPQSASHKGALNSRQRSILNYIADNQPVRLSMIVNYLHKESVNTIKKDLLHLRTLGYITAEGVLKGTVYYKN